MKGKRVTLTPKIEQWITAAVGEIDTARIAVYEAVAASTRPISQKGGFYDKAVIAHSMLDAMVEFVNGGGVVPLQAMHKTYGELPKGKVFRGSLETHEDGFSTDLITLFYLPLESEELVRDIDLGLIDEVSIGALSEKALCSECGYDYFDRSHEDWDLNIWMRTCDNGHVLGIDGVHLNLVGLESWKELSLVGRGASNKAKIRGATAQTLSKEDRERLAASGITHNHLFLYCSASEGESIVDTNKIITEITDLKAAALLHTSQLEAKDAELQLAQTSVTDLTAKLEAAQTELAELKGQDLGAQLEATKADLEKAQGAVDFVKEQAKLAVVAAGGQAKDFDSFEEAQAALSEASIKLHQLVPTDGASGGAPNDLKAPALVAGSSAFKSARR